MLQASNMLQSSFGSCSCCGASQAATANALFHGAMSRVEINQQVEQMARVLLIKSSGFF